MGVGWKDGWEALSGMVALLPKGLGVGIKTEIPYCDSTVNFLVGCDGCELSRGHCYAEALVKRYAGKPGWPIQFASPLLIPDRLEVALRWSDLSGTRREDKPWLNGMPRIVFANDLGDTFTDSIDWRIWPPFFDRMAGSPHIWLILTKRPNRLARFVEAYTNGGLKPWPRNIWCGVSVTGRGTTHRAAELGLIPVGVRFASCEPLLEPVWLGGARLDWVICGGESGAGARPFGVEWARRLRDQTVARKQAFFFKQGGALCIVRENTKIGPAALEEQHLIYGEWPEGTMFGNRTKQRQWNGRQVLLKDKFGRDMAEFPEDIVVRRMPLPRHEQPGT